MMFVLCALALFTVFLRTATNDSQLLEFGSCSRSCQNKSSGLNSKESSVSKILPPNHCSCTRSCAIYGDCCYDSPYRSQVSTLSKLRLMCLPLHGKGLFQAISTCVPEWNHRDNLCKYSIGHLPPVTSTSSGATYANHFCGICNNDDNLQSWNVELRCLMKNGPSDLSRYNRQQQRRGGTVFTSRKRWHCEYFTHYDDFAFLSKLELRTCSSNNEIFRCSMSWRNRSVSQLCQSYSDPVYINDKLYKNLHCAECNYENLASAKCHPTVVERLLSNGMNETEIYRWCQEEKHKDCLNYIRGASRGKAYTFSSMFKINEKVCIPEEGKLCCDGQRYDPRSKRCRKQIPAARKG